MKKIEYLDSIEEKRSKWRVLHYDDFTEEELETLPPCNVGKSCAYFDFRKHEWRVDYTY